MGIVRKILEGDTTAFSFPERMSYFENALVSTHHLADFY